MELDLGMTLHKDFLQRQSRSGETVVAAVADNCRFDERTGDARWKQFDAMLSRLTTGPDVSDWRDWAEVNRLYLDLRCNVATPTVPDAFLPINRDAWLDELAENQSVVRIEALTRPLQTSAISLDELEELLGRADSGDADADHAARRFFEAWNQRRDARPTFAAFYDEVRQEADDDDWPHALRDRLGLGHYGYEDGAPLAVALMRYSLEEVFSAKASRRLPVACALPTVLDGGMHEFFFPVPRENPYGATLHLSLGKADTLTAEIVHCRIDYKREHLWRLGRVARPHPLRGDDKLREARDLHLLALQVECDREDFGESFEGRT